MEEAVCRYVELPDERELSGAIDKLAASTPVTVDRDERTAPITVRWDGAGPLTSYEWGRTTDRVARRRPKTERDGE